MELKLIKPVIIIGAVVSVAVIGMLITKKGAVSTVSNDTQSKTQTANASQGLKAYVDPVTGEFISAPVGEDAIRNSLITSPKPENNNFPVTHHEDGSVSIDTSSLVAPLMATTDDSGKVHIEHANKTVKEVK